MVPLKVGVATVDITPSGNLPLMGNFRSDYLARGAHDPLQAKALVFCDAYGTKAALLAVDVCMLDRENTALMRATLASRCDVPPENVLIHATHTHAAPATSDRFALGMDFEAHRTAVEGMLAKATVAVIRANQRLAEARLSVGLATEYRVAFNRRLRHGDGSVQMNWESLQPGFDAGAIQGSGPTDPRLTCLVVEQEGRPVAALVHYALHPAILAGDNWLYSADYPGYLAEYLSKTMGGDFTTLFVNSACGNINHIDYRDPAQGRGFKMAERVGYLLGAAAHEAIAQRRAIVAEPLLVARDVVRLQRLPISAAELADAQRILRAQAGTPPPGQTDGLPQAYFAQLHQQMHQRQHQPDEVEIALLRLGSFALVGLPGEAFCELGLDLRRRSPAATTIVAGLTNDAIGYLPTRAAFAQGGYEVMPGSTFYVPGSGEQLVDAAVARLQTLFADHVAAPR